MKESTKKIIENIIVAILLGIILLSGNITVLILGLPVITIASGKILNLLYQNKIKNSIFTVSKDGKIIENALANPRKIVKLLSSSNKQAMFIEETKEMFSQLPKIDKQGKIIKYHTISHSLTYHYLKLLEQNGYITNLTKEKHKKKKLFFEKIIFGNTGNINKKYQTYQISFELTDKRLANNFDLTKPVETTIQNNPNSISQGSNIKKEIDDLYKLKAEIINNAYEDNQIKGKTK